MSDLKKIIDLSYFVVDVKVSATNVITVLFGATSVHTLQLLVVWGVADGISEPRSVAISPFKSTARTYPISSIVTGIPINLHWQPETARGRSVHWAKKAKRYPLSTLQCW